MWASLHCHVPVPSVISHVRYHFISVHVFLAVVEPFSSRLSTSSLLHFHRFSSFLLAFQFNLFYLGNEPVNAAGNQIAKSKGHFSTTRHIKSNLLAIVSMDK